LESSESTSASDARFRGHAEAHTPGTFGEAYKHAREVDRGWTDGLPRDDVRPGWDADRPVVAFYRDVLLRGTETYIRTQGEAMSRYRSHYVGMRRVSGLDLPDDRVLVLNRGDTLGRVNEIAFKLFGVSPPLERAFRALRPAVLHAHMGSDGAVALPLARRLRVPLVVTFRGFDATATDEATSRRGFRYRVFLRRREALKREARLFITVSEFIRRRLLALGFPEDRIIVHYTGVDTDVFRPDATVAREPIVLFVGRLIETKGATHLIAAMRAVQARVPDAELVFAGVGVLRESLERQARESGVRARFLGRVSHEEARRWMSRARALCLPSITASDGTIEGFGTVTVEAQAMGLPVVGSASGGIPEAVADGESGLLAPEGDAGALAQRIEALLTDAPLWERLSAAGVRRVREHFDVRRQTAKLEELYDEARGGRVHRT
jgi:glycosyltransferase involved in cell wall biosynthesis